MGLRRRRADRHPDYRQTLHEFSRSLALIVDEAQLHELIAAGLRDAFGFERIAIYRREADGTPFELASSRGPAADGAATFAADGRLARWLKVNEAPLVLAENPGVLAFLDAPERAALERMRAAACIPLVAMNRLTGFLVVGSAGRGPGLGLAAVEREFLAALGAQAALALENAALLRERKTRLKRMYRAERLATAGELAAGAAHEIRNPLTAVRSAVQYLRAGNPEATERDALFGDILAEVDRIDGIVEALLSFARPREVAFEPVELVGLLRQSLALTAARARNQGVALELDPAPAALHVAADPNLLKQVLLNVLLNALQAMPEGGTLRVAAGPRGRAVELRVDDTGCGIAPEHVERIFDPFFTTKKDGTGLGLSVCYGIVERHGGEMEVRSEPGRGTTMIVRLPQRSAR